MKISSEQLEQCSGADFNNRLAGIIRGIEKESLRVDTNGHLAQTPHPKSLGSALCNSWLTTDFSESLLEFVTPTFDSINAALGKLDELHHYAAQQLSPDEFLWPSSMPCLLPADEGMR